MANLISIPAAARDKAVERLLIFAAGLTVASIAVLPKLNYPKVTIALASLGASMTSIEAYRRSLKDRDNKLYERLQQEANDNLVADLLTAIETTETSKIKERLKVQQANSRARVAEFEVE
jgi:hypothetical protein